MAIVLDFIVYGMSKVKYSIQYKFWLFHFHKNSTMFPEAHMWLKYCPLIGHNFYELLMNFIIIIPFIDLQWIAYSVVS